MPEQGHNGDNRMVGYVVLTRHIDGSWRDDWDGEVHADGIEAIDEFEQAVGVLGRDLVCLATVTQVDDDELTRLHALATGAYL